MDSLRDKPSVRKIEKALEKLPTGSHALDRAYHKAMQRVDDQMEGWRVLAKKLLGWLTYSKRLMTVKEVRHALAIEPGASEFDKDNLEDVDEIVSFCAGLVIIDEETQIIRLVHYTTQEYFRRNGGTILACAQEDIAISCLTYLLYDEFEDGWLVDRDKDKIFRLLEVRRQNHPFLDYTAKYWAHHARVCEQQNVKELMMNFVKDDRRVSSASQVMLAVDYYRHKDDLNETKSCSPLSAMHVIAYFGFEKIISELLNRGFKADVEDSTHRTPLWWAAWQGHEAVVELLLSQNHVNVNNRGFSYQRGAPRYSETPLGAAAESGKDKIVKLLIQREDVDVNLPDGYGYSPLLSAVWREHSAVVEMLLTRRDIEVNSKHDLRRTPLFSAAYRGKEDVVKQLLKQKNIQVNTADHSECTPLWEAASNGWESVVELFLACSDIEVNAKDDRGRTPLSIAAENNQENEVKLLLSHADVEINPKDHLGKSPLTQAILEGSAGALKLLCAHPNVDLDPRDYEGRDVFALVKDARIPWLEGTEREKMRALKRVECLEILRTAIATRSQTRLQTPETVLS